MVDHIEAEAADMVFTEADDESLTSGSSNTLVGDALQDFPLRNSESEKLALHENAGSLGSSGFEEKLVPRKDDLSLGRTAPHFGWWPSSLSTWHSWRLASRFLSLITKRNSRTQFHSENPAAGNLRRVARTRRLVTTLTRVLSTKSEVVGRLRKRLLTPGEHGIVVQDDIEVAIYMGDVQGE